MLSSYARERISFWDKIAKKPNKRNTWSNYYHSRLTEIYRLLTTPGQSILEIGCGFGDLLYSLNAKFGVGIDFSYEMMRRARQNNKNIQFIQCDAHNLSLHGNFDTIILSDTVNDLEDVQKVFKEIGKISTSKTRVLINFYSHLWEPVLKVAQVLKLAVPTLPQNWLTVDDIKNLLNLEGFEVIRHWEEILFPLPIPILKQFTNKFLARFWPFKILALTNFIVARRLIPPRKNTSKPMVSVVIPTRNEAGNIPEIFLRIPEIGNGTELIFIEGNSTDFTYETIKKEIKRHPDKNCKLFRQPGTGKGDAVRFGFSKASGEILMILDADLTVPPESLIRFYEALYLGKGEFINGVRLIYPLEKNAMKFFNFCGNKFFSILFKWLLGQPIKDTLCGTKALWKKDYERIIANRSFFGDFDPFGDFDLLFGASKLNLKIIELPIRYKRRIYGKTNIKRWSHGFLLLKMAFFASIKLKFR